MLVVTKFNDVDYLFSCKHREIPDTDLTYCISDIHGMYEQLVYLHEKIKEDIEKNPNKTYKVIFHGDYVDRGLNSRLVLEYLMKLEENPNYYFLMGNHDQMLLQYCVDFEYKKYKSSYKETFESFEGGKIPEKVVKWIGKLYVALVDSKRIYVHAGINPYKTIQNTSDCIWIRREFLDYPWDMKKLVVHGHTPDDTGPIILNNRVNVDTGAYYSGILSCAVFDNDTIRTIQVVGNPIAKFRKN